MTSIALVCPKCTKPISSEEFTEVLGKSYHTACFNCERCNANLMNGFHNNNGYFYCKACYSSFLPKCENCKKQIGSGRCVKAFETNFHLECFVCATCQKPFEDGRFFGLKKTPYCLSDYWKQKAELQKSQQQNEPEQEPNKQTQA